jgi:coenzyme F420-dependent glucose-6-phosphate dehydrogenase
MESFTPCQRCPLLLGAAVTETTAVTQGGWGDGLLTVNAKPDQLKKVVEAFRRGGGVRPLKIQTNPLRGSVLV